MAKEPTLNASSRVMRMARSSSSTGAASDGVPTLSYALGDACLPALRGYC